MAAVAEKLPAQAFFQPDFSKSPVSQIQALAAYYTEKKIGPPITVRLVSVSEQNVLEGNFFDMSDISDFFFCVVAGYERATKGKLYR